VEQSAPELLAEAWDGTISTPAKENPSTGESPAVEVESTQQPEEHGLPHRPKPMPLLASKKIGKRQRESSPAKKSSIRPMSLLKSTVASARRAAGASKREPEQINTERADAVASARATNAIENQPLPALKTYRQDNPANASL